MNAVLKSTSISLSVAYIFSYSLSFIFDWYFRLLWTLLCHWNLTGEGRGQGRSQEFLFRGLKIYPHTHFTMTQEVKHRNRGRGVHYFIYFSAFSLLCKITKVLLWVRTPEPICVNKGWCF